MLFDACKEIPGVIQLEPFAYDVVLSDGIEKVKVALVPTNTNILFRHEKIVRGSIVKIPKRNAVSTNVVEKVHMGNPILLIVDMEVVESEDTKSGPHKDGFYVSPDCEPYNGTIKVREREKATNVR